MVFVILSQLIQFLLLKNTGEPSEGTKILRKALEHVIVSLMSSRKPNIWSFHIVVLQVTNVPEKEGMYQNTTRMRKATVFVRKKFFWSCSRFVAVPVA